MFSLGNGRSENAGAFRCHGPPRGWCARGVCPPRCPVRPRHPHGCRRARPKARAPDFTGLAKIAALGVKVSRHCAYHGVALNVHMDLSPFSRINPCGYAGLQTTDLLQSVWMSVGHKLPMYWATSLPPPYRPHPKATMSSPDAPPLRPTRLTNLAPNKNRRTKSHAFQSKWSTAAKP